VRATSSATSSWSALRRSASAPNTWARADATLAYREGVALEVIGALLTHRSPTSTLVYTHPTAADLRKALAERGVLDKVADLV
jgi:site-specific recombinase XerD